MATLIGDEKYPAEKFIFSPSEDVPRSVAQPNVLINGVVLYMVLPPVVTESGL